LPASLTLSPKSVTNVIVTMRGGAPALHRDGNGGLKNTRQFLLGSVLHSLAIPLVRGAWCVGASFFGCNPYFVSRRW
jgi:hypothetical protein